jgi:hypothetical protein
MKAINCFAVAAFGIFFVWMGSLPIAAALTAILYGLMSGIAVLIGSSSRALRRL